WIARAEQELARVQDAVLDVEADQHQRLVAGEHARLFGHRTHRGVVHLQHGLDRSRELEVQARIHLPAVFAEAQYDAAFAFLDDGERVEREPDHQRAGDQQRDAAQATGTAAVPTLSTVAATPSTAAENAVDAV